MAMEKREKTMIRQTGVHTKNHALDLLKLPEAARQELFTFFYRPIKEAAYFIRYFCNYSAQ